MDLAWMYRDKDDFMKFVDKLSGLPMRAYESPFICALLEKQWHLCKSELVANEFSLYVIYCFL